MKKIAVLLAAADVMLSDCVAYEVPSADTRAYRGDRDRDRDGIPNQADRDRDGDGVRNREDHRPNDPRRY
ncbi:MAG: hypothetical protein IPI44_21635 [Sulfuritalea sp.]|nr:hypothetical protein [Sulfuritalea sp.]